MFKPAHSAVGCIVSPITSMSNVLTLDPDSYAALDLALDTGDFTYMRLGEGSIVEVVRVFGTLGGNMVEVARGQDGTLPRAFAANTDIVYCFCAAAVEHMIAAISPPNVLIQAADNSPIVVTELAANQYEIGMEPISISSPNGSIVVTGEFPDIELALDPSSTGCGCN